jgi:hypothetical protein
MYVYLHLHNTNKNPEYIVFWLLMDIINIPA